MTRRQSRSWDDRLSIVLVVGLLIVGGLASILATQTNVLSRYYDDTSDDVASLCDDRSNADKTECAEPPPDAPELLPGPQGPGVSADEVRAAVNELLPVFIGPGIADYCGDGRCVGPRGSDSNEPGPPGEDSTVPGPPGEDSTVPGPPGADSTVPGPKGDKGDPGEDWACPEGTSLQETTVMTSPVDSTVIYACR